MRYNEKVGLIKRYFREILVLLLIVILYFGLRLPNLTLQPIFADEAIYIRWAQVMRAEPTLRFLPLSDGKPPLFMWVMIPLFKVFEDPLFAGRFLSVLSGFATLSGIWFLGWKFFNLRVAFWSSFLVVITPFMIFFDRMALVDSMLTAFSVWSLNLALLLIRYPRIDLAMILGYFLGGGLLTKPPGFFNILALPVILWLFDWTDKTRQLKLLKIVGLWMLAVAIGLTIYNVLRLGPGFSNISSRNQDYVFSPVELIGRPLDPFLPHFNDLVDWFPKLFTMPVLLLVGLGVALAVLRRNKYALVVLLWSLIPLLIQMAFLKTFTARYILFSIPPLLFLGGWAMEEIINKVKLKRWMLIASVISVLLISSLSFSLKMMTDLENLPLPRSERSGYLEGWTAGYGLKEIAQFLMDESRNGLVVVGTEGSFGTLPDGLQIYLDKHSHAAPKENQVAVIGGKATISAQLRDSARDHPTFFIANGLRSLLPDGVKLLKEYPKAQKPDGTYEVMLLFQVLPK